MMGMFSALKAKAPSATLCYISCKMRAVKNKTVEYLDAMPQERRDRIIKRAINLGEKQRQRRRRNQKELMEEITGRLVDREQDKDQKRRNIIEKTKIDQDSLEKAFPDLSEAQVETLVVLLTGKCVGQYMYICHIWHEDRLQVPYNGLLEKVFGKGATKKYVVSYWPFNQIMDRSEDSEYDMGVFALGADYILKDLTI
ncbi:hypothetical protein SNE40_005123 [Patella caerulea]|uniref:Uncharacterized protein n=2 Tax=Patella caerulea TaxID=87958 RepID=A0AAN8KAU9_PATCE